MVHLFFPDESELQLWSIKLWLEQGECWSDIRAVPGLF